MRKLPRDRRTLALWGIPAETDVKLRGLLQELEFRVFPDGPVPRESLRGLEGSPAVVSLDGDPDEAFRAVRELDAAGLRVLVLGPRKEADLILRAMREGAKEFVVAGEEEHLVRSIREIARPAGANGGEVFAVFPAKGGVGATTIATNLAGAFQAAGLRVCLVDLDLTMGDVLAFLDLPAGYSIADVMANLRRLDRELLDSSLLRHRSGVYVLAQSHRIDESDRVDAAGLASLLEFLRQHYDVVVVDGLRGFDELSVAALDECDRILLVVTQEVPAVRDAKRSLDLLRRLGQDSRVALVVNRCQRGPQITPQVIAETVGLPVHARISNDYPAVVGAVNKGVLLQENAPRAQVTRDVEALAVSLHPAATGERPNRASLFGRIFPGRRTHAAQ